MKRIALLTALLALLVSGVSLAAGTPAGGCACQTNQASTDHSGLTALELTR